MRCFEDVDDEYYYEPVLRQQRSVQRYACRERPMSDVHNRASPPFLAVPEPAPDSLRRARE